jgi:hypothetical protein
MWDLIEDKYSEEYKIGRAKFKKKQTSHYFTIMYRVFDCFFFLFIIQSILFLSLLPPKEIKKK